jgi:hypothetical protein
MLVAQELVTVRKSVLGNPHGSIARARDVIIRRSICSSPGSEMACLPP